MIENHVLRRTLLLALFLISMLGPWMFDLLSVPAEYTCDVPFVRLSDDFCGYPLSGFETIEWFGGGVFYMLAELIKGSFVPRLGELVVLIGTAIIVLPFFSILLPVANRNSRRLKIINVIVCGAACLPAFVMFIAQANRGHFIQFFSLLWGLSLYILLAIVTILSELHALRPGIPPRMDVESTKRNTSKDGFQNTF